MSLRRIFPRFLSEGFGACVLIGLLCYGFWTSRFGLDFSDEGFYLSSALRYALGDIPFRDDVSNFARSFDVLLWPIFVLFPHVTLLELRLLNVAVQLAALTSLYLLLKRYAPAYLAALATATSAFVCAASIKAPGYNSLGNSFSFLAISLWLLACVVNSSRLRWILAVVSGICFALMVLSFFPLVAIGVIPGIVWMVLFFRRRIRSPHGEATSVSLMIAVGLIMVAVGIVFTSGLARHIPGNLQVLRTIPTYGQGFGERLADYWLAFRGWTPWITGFAAIGIGAVLILPLGGDREGWVTKLIGPLALTGLMVLVLLAYRAPARRFYFQPLHVSYCLLAMAVGFTLVNAAVLFQMRNKSVNWGKDWLFVYWILIAAFSVSSFIQGIVSSNGYTSSRLGIGPVLAAGIIGLSRMDFWATGVAPQLRRSFLVGHLAVLCLVLLAFNLCEYYRYVYRDAKVSDLTAVFQHPLLRGIRSTPERVRVVEEVLQFLQGRLLPGEYLLEYSDAPLFYYLTHTRPAVASVWVNPRPDLQPHRDYLFQRMVREGHVPRYCLRALIVPWGLGLHEKPQRQRYRVSDRLNAYILQHYELVQTIQPFEIWERKEPGGR